jgi:DNA repair protein RecO
MATRSASFDAIILRAKEVPSGARVVTLLSADEGIVEAFVFGGGKSKLRSLASPWYFGKAWIYRDASRGLVKLTDFDAVREYPGIRADLPSIAAASFASEFMAATSALGGDWADALSLCADFLSALDEASGRGEPEATARALALFAMRALELMGLSPDGDECSACAGALRRDTLHSYSRRTGGFLCARCAASENDAVALPARARLARSRRCQVIRRCRPRRPGTGRAVGPQGLRARPGEKGGRCAAADSRFWTAVRRP